MLAANLRRLPSEVVLRVPPSGTETEYKTAVCWAAHPTRLRPIPCATVIRAAAAFSPAGAAGRRLRPSNFTTIRCPHRGAAP
jgi:hypothetical protein